MKLPRAIVDTQVIKRVPLRAKQTTRNGNLQEITSLLPVVMIPKKPKPKLVIAGVANRPGLPLLVITVPGQGGVVGLGVVRPNLVTLHMLVLADKMEQKRTRMYVIPPVRDGHHNLSHLIVQQFRPVVPSAGQEVSANPVIIMAAMATHLRMGLTVAHILLVHAMQLLKVVPTALTGLRMVLDVLERLRVEVVVLHSKQEVVPKLSTNQGRIVGVQ